MDKIKILSGIRMHKTILAMMSFVLLSLSFSSCIEEFNADLPASETHLLVVEGSIIGNQTCEFNLTRTFNLKDSMLTVSQNYVKEAKIFVKGSDGQQFEGYYVCPGCFEVNVGQLSTDQTYWLEVEVEDEQYKSSPLAPLVTPEIESLTFAQPREDLEVDILVTPAEDPLIDTSKPLYYCWTRDIWWEVHTPYRTLWDFVPETGEIITADPVLWRGFRHERHYEKSIGCNIDYKDGRIKDFRIYSEDHNSDRFIYKYYTKVRQMSISAEEYAYEKQNAQQSEAMGGLFTPQPSELPGNIICTSNPDKSVIGYIGVCANTTEKELYIYTTQVGYKMRYQIDTYSNILDDLGFASYAEAYNAGFRILDYNPYAGIMTWTIRYAVDCTCSPWYASLDVPDFWPKE